MTDADAGEATAAGGALSALLRELASTGVPGPAWEETLAPGETIGRFELLRELGRGGFGVVYEARDTELGRSVAFKAVRPGRSELGGEQLMREAEAIARLSHPNLVTLYDVGRCERGPYLVLELLRGQTLERRLEQGPLGAGEALRIAAEVARGLAHAHDQGVVHRDLKPSNVFLCESGAVKVLDFGMAHAFGRQRISGGTPAFMAPEQWRGAPEDERTDVFALGAMLFRMLAGELPFPNDGGKSVTSPRPARVLEVQDFPGLGALVGRMLSKDPVGRPRSGAAVVEELEPLDQERSRSASTVPGTVRVRREAGRLLLAAGAALVLAASILGGLLLGHRLGADPTPAGFPSVAVLPFESPSAARDDVLFAEGIHDELITQLAKMSGLRVIARGSVQQYRERPRDLKAIAAALGVGTILEGTVLKSGGRVRIAAQLVDPRSGLELWGDRFDRELADVFAIQTEVALEIAGALGARLSVPERQLVGRLPTRDREAHDLFLRGSYYWQRSIGVETDNRMAVDLFEKAIARDPSFALAHAWLAMAQVEWAGDCKAAATHADQALSLEPDLPQAHSARGHYHYYCEKDVPAAIREYEQAVRGAPGDAVARAFLASIRTSAGLVDEGLADFRAALGLDPRSYLVAVELAKELAHVRRFDEAAHVCQQARDIAPGDVHAMILGALIPVWRDGDLLPAGRLFDVLPPELPNSGNGAWSLFQLLALFPERALALAGAGRIPEPFASNPLIPRGLVIGAAHAALGQEALARVAFAATLEPLRARLRERPEDLLSRLFLLRALAGTGKHEEAMQGAAGLMASATDEDERITVLRGVAEIATACRRPEAAVDALADVLGRRGGLLTPASVRVDPRYAALRGNPRFEALVSPGTESPAPASP